jgi:hypothetical protein
MVDPAARARDPREAQRLNTLPEENDGFCRDSFQGRPAKQREIASNGGRAARRPSLICVRRSPATAGVIAWML